MKAFSVLSILERTHFILTSLQVGDFAGREIFSGHIVSAYLPNVKDEPRRQLARPRAPARGVTDGGVGSGILFGFVVIKT